MSKRLSDGSVAYSVARVLRSNGGSEKASVIAKKLRSEGTKVNTNRIKRVAKDQVAMKVYDGKDPSIHMK